MKKHLLLAGLTLCAGFSANAQVSISRIKPVSNPKALVSAPLKRGNDKTTASSQFKSSNLFRNSSASAGAFTPIVQTAYDEQRDGAISNVPGTDKLSVVITGSQSSDAAYPDRGSFYAFFDGTQWKGMPNKRIEHLRTGWPTISVSKTGKEIIVSHNFVTNKTILISRDTAGTGKWHLDSTLIVGSWPRVYFGGADGNTIHIFATNNKDTLNNIFYYRSTDGGATFSKSLLPNDRHSLGGNFYSVDVRGNTIALAAGGSSFRPPLLYKSTDNGTTWTENIIWSNLPMNYDSTGVLTDKDNDGKEDTLYNSDGYAKILIDNNNTVHWFSGAMRYLRTSVSAKTGDSVNYFPLDNKYGMLYWNDKLPKDSIFSIANMIDVNGDNKLTIEGRTTTVQDLPVYNYLGPVSMPTASYDSLTGALSCLYPAMTENTGDTGSFTNWVAYRDLYVVTAPKVDSLYVLSAINKTANNFGVPVNITKNPTSADALENVYPSAAKYNHATKPELIPTVWQQDPDQGTALQKKAAAPYKKNQIVTNVATPVVVIGNPVTDEKTGITSFRLTGFSAFAAPNPTGFTTCIAVNTTIGGSAVLTVFNTMGQKVVEKTANLTAGSNNNAFNLSKEELGAGMFIYTVKVGENSTVQKLIVE